MAINASAVWRVRPSGNNLNGGGYDAGIGGAATDYSQQNAAQATGTHATCTTGGSTFVDATANAFTSAMVGNCIQIASGTNFTAGFYFVTAFTSASTVTLDRDPTNGSNASVGVWKLGGGWADYWTNGTVAKAALVPGNTVFILGSGTPNPASYSADYTQNVNFASVPGDTTNGYITFANDPATPGYKAPPDTTGGMPLILVSVINTQVFAAPTSDLLLKGLWYISNNGGGGGLAYVMQGNNSTILGCVVDNSRDSITLCGNGASSTTIIATEIMDSFGGIGSGAVQSTGTVTSCNFHDVNSDCVDSSNGAIVVSNTIVAKIGGTGKGVRLRTGGGFPTYIVVQNCTIDGCGGDGISIADQKTLECAVIFNNIISNNTAGGAFGMDVLAGTTAANDRFKLYVDYNVFYNNTSNYNAISAGPHDTALGVSPYNNSTTEDYSLA